MHRRHAQQFTSRSPHEGCAVADEPELASSKQRVAFDELQKSADALGQQLLYAVQSTVARTYTAHAHAHAHMHRMQLTWSACHACLLFFFCFVFFFLFSRLVAGVKESELADIESCLEQIEAHYAQQAVALRVAREAKVARIGALCAELDAASAHLARLQEHLKAFYDQFLRE